LSTDPAAPGILTRSNIMTADNQQAVNAFAATLANCNTPQAIEGAVSQYMRQWGAQERQIKIYPNGLAKVEVLDKDMALIAEYTRPSKGIWVDAKDDAGYMISEKAYLDGIVEFAASIEGAATEDQSDDVFGADTRTVAERRESVARQLRRLADMAVKLAEKIES
jgi:hypothetical protein